MAMSGEDPGRFLLGKFDDVARWAQSSSVWPLTMGLACCAIEMMTSTAPEYDLARLGSEVFRASPRQADLMIVSGRLSRKMVPVVLRLYKQMADPKWVISMGACASSKGMFDNYAIVPVDLVIPVDVYAAGCPPTPDNLIYAINLIQQQIRNGGPRRRAVTRIGLKESGMTNVPTQIQAAIDVERIAPEALRNRATALKAEGFAMLLDIGGVDYPNRPARFEVVYHFMALAPSSSDVTAIASPRRLRLIVAVGESNAVVPSLTDLWPNADWAEREVYDLFGVVFSGHPDLRRIQMPTDWEGHPLRKDFPVRGLIHESTPLPNFASKSNVPASTPPSGRVAMTLEQRAVEARNAASREPS